MSHIRLNNIIKQYGNFRALDNISLEISDGEMFFLLGASGCGKTTLLRCIGGFEQADAGTIFLDDQNVTALPPYQRNTGMVFQGYALWPHKTVYENVAFGLEMQKISGRELKKRVEECLEQIQILDLANRKPNELSGGQQQRVALARTLITRPNCLLLDEPLANLDAKLRRDMRLEIRRICKDAGLTAIYVTHDRQEALSMADRIAVMNQGQIIQLGAPREIYRRPANAFVAGFIGETNLIPGTIIDDATVETAAGRLKISPCHCHTPGSQILLNIRPEAISLKSSEGANRLEVISQYMDYLGEIADHGALTAIGNIPLKFSELNPVDAIIPGEHLTVFVLPEDICVMSA